MRVFFVDRQIKMSSDAIYTSAKRIKALQRMRFQTDLQGATQKSSNPFCIDLRQILKQRVREASQKGDLVQVAKCPCASL